MQYKCTGRETHAQALRYTSSLTAMHTITSTSSHTPTHMASPAQISTHTNTITSSQTPMLPHSPTHLIADAPTLVNSYSTPILTDTTLLVFTQIHTDMCSHTFTTVCIHTHTQTQAYTPPRGILPPSPQPQPCCDTPRSPVGTYYYHCTHHYGPTAGRLWGHSRQQQFMATPQPHAQPCPACRLLLSAAQPCLPAGVRFPPSQYLPHFVTSELFRELTGASSINQSPCG